MCIPSLFSFIVENRHAIALCSSVNCTKKRYVIKSMCENVHAVIMNLELFRVNIDRNERIYYAIKFMQHIKI